MQSKPILLLKGLVFAVFLGGLAVNAQPIVNKDVAAALKTLPVPGKDGAYIDAVRLPASGPVSPLSAAQPTEPGAKGWFWYQDPDKEPEPPPPDRAPAGAAVVGEPQSRPDPLLSPEQEMVALRLRLEQMEDITQLRAEVARHLDTAVAKPTERNLLLYMTAQQFVMARAEKFAVVWHEVLRKYPEVDDGVNNPNRSDAARPIYVNAMNAQIRSTLGGLNDRYALLFFFRGDCPFCHKQAKILQTMSKAHGFNVMPISLDGRGIPEYPNPRVEPSFVEGLGIKTVPSMMLMRRGSTILEPIATGLTTMDVIEGRITSIVSQAESPGGQWGKYRAERSPVNGIAPPGVQRY